MADLLPLCRNSQCLGFHVVFFPCCSSKEKYGNICVSLDCFGLAFLHGWQRIVQRKKSQMVVSQWKACSSSDATGKHVENHAEASLLQQWLLPSVHEEDALLIYNVSTPSTPHLTDAKSTCLWQGFPRVSWYRFLFVFLPLHSSNQED